MTAVEDERPHVWANYLCIGCGAGVLHNDPETRLCTECYFGMLETTAARLDPSYDPAKEHDWPECAAILWRLGWKAFTQQGEWFPEEYP